MRIHVGPVTAVLALVGQPPFAAQDVNAEQTFGTVELNAGFEPDPRKFEVVSGGDLQASEEVSADCRGFIANVPDVRIKYTTGDYPLIFEVIADTDSTLAINAPDGSWYCDDDGADGFDPLVHFAYPERVSYDVFIGSYDGDNADATLIISEIDH